MHDACTLSGEPDGCGGSPSARNKRRESGDLFACFIT